VAVDFSRSLLKDLTARRVGRNANPYLRKRGRKDDSELHFRAFPDLYTRPSPVRLSIGPRGTSMEIHFRIVVLDPPAGVTFRIQRGRSELLAPSSESATAMAFDFTLRAERHPDGHYRLLGPFAQGPPSERFVYVNSGKRAGQPESQWDRRAKVHLRDLSASMIEQAEATGGVIETRITGTAGDGGPACATVPLVGGWQIAS